MEVIRLMLVDDHEVVRSGLKVYLNNQTDMLVICEAGDGLSAIQIALVYKPDIIVMDISMPGMDGLEATNQLSVFLPETSILALTMHVDRQYFLEMMAAGVKGYVTKQSVADELLTAIRIIAEGGVYLPPVFARWLLEDYQRWIKLLKQPDSTQSQTESDNSEDILTHRETEVLKLVATGKTNNQIGEILEISPKTVARHRERIMTKLDIHSSIDMVRYAIRKNIVSLT